MTLIADVRPVGDTGLNVLRVISFQVCCTLLQEYPYWLLSYANVCDPLYPTDGALPKYGCCAWRDCALLI